MNLKAKVHRDIIPQLFADLQTKGHDLMNSHGSGTKTHLAIEEMLTTVRELQGWVKACNEEGN